MNAREIYSIIVKLVMREVYQHTTVRKAIKTAPRVSTDTDIFSRFPPKTEENISAPHKWFQHVAKARHCIIGFLLSEEKPITILTDIT